MEREGIKMDMGIGKIGEGYKGPSPHSKDIIQERIKLFFEIHLFDEQDEVIKLFYQEFPNGEIIERNKNGSMKVKIGEIECEVRSIECEVRSISQQEKESIKMKYEHCAGVIKPFNTKNTEASMRSWNSNNPEEHLECMIGLIAYNVEHDADCKTEVEKTDTGLQIKISNGNMAMTINQNGQFAVYENVPWENVLTKEVLNDRQCQ